MARMRCRLDSCVAVSDWLSVRRGVMLCQLILVWLPLVVERAVGAAREIERGGDTTGTAV